MQKYPFSAIITSYDEKDLVKEAIKNPLIACQNYTSDYEIIIMAGDDETYNAAKSVSTQYSNVTVLNDGGKGKPNALNIAADKSKNDILILTDGDVIVDKNAITELFSEYEPSVAGISGHPLSIDNKSTMFGYFSHLFCEAANIKRQGVDFTPMSGYLLLTKKLNGLFPIPTELRAEDAYISYWLHQNNLKIRYAKNALVYVRFPKNLKDWLKQKTRSLGGNIQLGKFTANLPQVRSYKQRRGILQDIQMLLFPIRYAKSFKELYFSLCLYPIRLYLWIMIYINHCFGKYKTGRWETITSSKK